MAKILVTGATGFIGSHLCLVLLSKGYEIIAVDSFENSSPESLIRVKKIFALRRAASCRNDIFVNSPAGGGDFFFGRYKIPFARFFSPCFTSSPLCQGVARPSDAYLRPPCLQHWVFCPPHSSIFCFFGGRISLVDQKNHRTRTGMC